MTSALLLLSGILAGGVASYLFQNGIRKDIAFLQNEHAAIKKEMSVVVRMLARI